MSHFYLRTGSAWKRHLISSWPVIFFGVFHCKLFELLIHLPVEVVSEEEGPEPKQSVHLLRQANPQPFPLCREKNPIMLIIHRRPIRRHFFFFVKHWGCRAEGCVSCHVYWCYTIKAASAVLVISLLSEAVVPQHLMGWMPEFGQRLGGAAVASWQQCSFWWRGVRAAVEWWRERCLNGEANKFICSLTNIATLNLC